MRTLESFTVELSDLCNKHGVVIKSTGHDPSVNLGVETLNRSATANIWWDAEIQRFIIIWEQGFVEFVNPPVKEAWE